MRTTLIYSVLGRGACVILVSFVAAFADEAAITDHFSRQYPKSADGVYRSKNSIGIKVSGSNIEVISIDGKSLCLIEFEPNEKVFDATFNLEGDRFAVITRGKNAVGADSSRLIMGDSDGGVNEASKCELPAGFVYQIGSLSASGRYLLCEIGEKIPQEGNSFIIRYSWVTLDAKNNWRVESRGFDGWCSFRDK